MRSESLREFAFLWVSPVLPFLQNLARQILATEEKLPVLSIESPSNHTRVGHVCARTSSWIVLTGELLGSEQKLGHSFCCHWLILNV